MTRRPHSSEYGPKGCIAKLEVRNAGGRETQRSLSEVTRARYVYCRPTAHHVVRFSDAQLILVPMIRYVFSGIML